MGTTRREAKPLTIRQAKPLTIKSKAKPLMIEQAKDEGESKDGQVKADVLGKIILTSCNLKDRPGIANQ